MLTLLQQRRSVRKFTSQVPDAQTVAQLVEAILRAPSSRNLCPCSFVVVTDREQLTRLADAKPHGAGFLREAPLAIVVCADTSISDVWVEDASIASIVVQLAAESMALGSCWSQIRKRAHADGRSARDYVADVLDLPEGMEVEAIIGIGYPEKRAPGHDRSDLHWDRVFINRFGQSLADGE